MNCAAAAEFPKLHIIVRRHWVALLMLALLALAGCGADDEDGVQQPTDSDGDGLMDAEEMRGWPVKILLVNGEILKLDVKSDPFKPDTDGDGLSDILERDLATDPRSRDTDGDELSDNDEWTQWFSDPRAQDTDGDRLLDVFEALFLKTSPIMADTDGDGFTDPQEVLELSRDPRVADLPRPRLDVGDVALRLDTRFSFTDRQGQSRTTEESTGTTLTKSRDEKFAQSDSSTTKNTFESKLTIGTEVSASLTSLGAKFSQQLELGYSFADERTISLSEEVSEKAEEAYQQSLKTAESVDETKEVTRQVVGASIEVPVTIANVSNTAFRLTNLEVTALLQDPIDRTRFLPVGTLVPATLLDTGVIPEITTGPFVPERGPFIFKTRDVFPSLVEDLLRAPRGLVFQVVNFDITDEAGRNFAFVSQEVNDRTAGIIIDFGDRSDHFRVSTAGKFDEAGKPRGITLGYALQDILGLPKNGARDAITVGANGCGETFAASDDVQVVPPACPPVRSDGIVVTAGSNGVIDSVPRGDDQLVQDCSSGSCIEIVKDGGDGCAHTRALGDDVQASGECDSRSADPGIACASDDPCRDDEHPDGSCVGACARGGPNGEIVRAGPNGVLDTVPKRDDVIATISGYGTEVARTCDGTSVRPGIMCDGDPDCRDGQHPSGLCRPTEVLTRVESTAANPARRRAWWVLASADIDISAGLDDIPLHAGDRISLAFVEDKDGDGLFSREEFIHGSSDDDADTDDDGLGDFEEVQTGWDVSVEGLRPYRAFSHPGRPDSDSDRLSDRDELINGTDPRKRDTDGDGISDFEELYGFAVVDSRRGEVLRVVLPYEGDPSASLRAICDGGNGIAETQAALDDKQIISNGNVGPKLGVVVLPGANGVLDTTQPAGDDLLCEATCTDCKTHDRLFASNPLNQDTDADGLPDGVERTLGADPNDPKDAARFRDDDLDGLTNAEEQEGWVVLLETLQQDDAGAQIAFDCLDNSPAGVCQGTDEPCLENGDCVENRRCLTGACDYDGVIRCAQDFDCVDIFHPFARCLAPQIRLFVCERLTCTESSSVCRDSGTCEFSVCENSGRCAGSGHCTKAAPGQAVGPACTTDAECASFNVEGQSLDLGTCDATFSCTSDLQCEAGACVGRTTCADSSSCACIQIPCTSDEGCGAELGRCSEPLACTAASDCPGLCESSGRCQDSGRCQGSGICEGRCEGSGRCDVSDDTCTTDDDCDGESCVNTSTCAGGEECGEGVACLYTSACTTDAECTGGPLGATPCLSSKPCAVDEQCGDGIPCQNPVLCTTADSCGGKACLGAETCVADEECGGGGGSCVSHTACDGVSGLGCHEGSCGDGLCVSDQGTDTCTNDSDCAGAAQHCTQPDRCKRVSSDAFEPDTDSDGLPDLLESNLSSDPTSPDTDNDVLFDFDELSSNSTFSIAPSVFRNFTERCLEAPRCVYNPQGSQLYGTSVVSGDTDGDGLDDFVELFDTWVVRVPGKTPIEVNSSPLSADADLDGARDSQEKSERTDPGDPDTDDDNLLDSEDPTPDGRPGVATVTFVSWNVGGDDCDPGARGAGDFGFTLSVKWKCGTSQETQRSFPGSVGLNGGATYEFQIAQPFTADESCSVTVGINIEERDSPDSDEDFNYSRTHEIDAPGVETVTIRSANFTALREAGATIGWDDGCWLDDTIVYQVKWGPAGG